MRILLVNETARSHTGGLNRVVVESIDWLRRAGHVVALGFWDGGPSEVAEPVFRLPHTDSPAEMRAAVDRIRRDFQPEVAQLHSAENGYFLETIARDLPAGRFLHDQSWFCSGGDRMTGDFTPCHRPHGVGCLFWHYAQRCGGKKPWGNWQRWTRTQAHQALKQSPAFRIQVASEFMRQGLLENGYAAGQIDVIPLFANPPSHPPATEPGLMLAACRLVKSKGLDVLLEAVKRLPTGGPGRESSQLAAAAGNRKVDGSSEDGEPADGLRLGDPPRSGDPGRDPLDWRLAIAGDGPERVSLQQMAARLGLTARVQFLGELAPGELDAWYARAAFVVSPVLRPEPFGLIGLEAMAHGKPIIAFAGGATEEWLVDGKTGRVVRERSAEALGWVMGELLSRPQVRRAMGEAARRRWEEYRPELFVRRLVESFARCMENFRSGKP